MRLLIQERVFERYLVLGQAPGRIVKRPVSYTPLLPEGPICNPGKEAIEAALYPDETYLDENYLYFCLGDPETGETVFSKTLQEHNANVEKYRPLWIEADEKNNTTGQ